MRQGDSRSPGVAMLLGLLGPAALAGDVLPLKPGTVVVAPLTTPNPASASRITLAAAAAGALQLVVSDKLEEEYRRPVEHPQVVRDSAKLNRQALVSAVVELRTRDG